MTIPFTYLIGWPEHNLYYYGVRYKSGCNPNDLCTTYFTSSRLVHSCILKYGTPTLRQIRKTFKLPKQALVWEQTVLRRLKVLYNDKWLNKNISGAIEFDDRIRKLMSEAKKGLIWVHKDGKKTCIRKELLNFYLSEGFSKGHGQKYIGEKNPMYGKQHTKETKAKIGKANARCTLTDEGRKSKSEHMKKNNPMHNEQIKENYLNAMVAVRERAKRKVECSGVVFSSLTEASQQLNIPIPTIHYRCNKKIRGWRYAADQ